MLRSARVLHVGLCNHSAEINADWLPDETLVRSLCPRMVCTRCGLIGADVRPDWRPHINKPRPGSQSSRQRKFASVTDALDHQRGVRI
jgi:hypothetical protein